MKESQLGMEITSPSNGNNVSVMQQQLKDVISSLDAMYDELSNDFNSDPQDTEKAINALNQARSDISKGLNWLHDVDLYTSQ